MAAESDTGEMTPLGGDPLVSAAMLVAVLSLLAGGLYAGPRLQSVMREARAARALRARVTSLQEQVLALDERLKAADLAHARFFANVSHELRTPLALILGTTETLLGEQRDDPDEPLATVRRNALLLHRHVDDMLALAEAGAGHTQVRYCHVDLAQLLRETAAHFSHLATSRRVSLKIDAPARLHADVDPHKVRRIVLNLLFNAFKFTPTEGHVVCDLRLEDDDVMLRVRDSGPGVPADAKARIFDPFQQASAPTGAIFGGTGLGLSISRELARAHGGSVILEDENPLGGASFAVRLPQRAPTGIELVDDLQHMDELGVRVAETAATELALRLESGVTERPPASKPREPRAHVLVVEDDPGLRRFLQGVLSARYDVSVAASAPEALELAQASPPDLILTDVMMPDGGGEELLASLRADEALLHVPVVVLTAVNRDDTSVRLLERGAVDYVAKPFRLSELLARVAVHLAQKRTRDALSEVVRDQQEDLEGLAKEVAAKSRELSRALEAAEVAREVAERGEAAKARFLSMMTHELRTPLAALQLQVRLLAPRGQAAERYEVDASAVERAQRCCLRLRDLVDSLLEVARAESGRLVLRPTETELQSLVTSVLADFETQARHKGLTLGLDPVTERLPLLFSDRSLVRLVLVNLIGNAVKYTSEGEVRVTIAFFDGAHRVTVTDTGPGIPENKRDLIFEPFLQLDDLRGQRGDGSGLGLAIVRDLVHALGGEVRLKDAPNGAAFEVSLPPAKVEAIGEPTKVAAT